MRILYAVHGYKPAYRVGGPILSVSSIAEFLVRRGHNITVFTSNSNLDQDLDVPLDQPVMVEGVEVWYFRRREILQEALPFMPYLSKSMGFLYAPRMRAELDRVVPAMDLVHTHMPYVYPSLAAGRAALRHGKALFYHQRGVYDPARLRFRGLKKRAYIVGLERPIMRRATTLIALTEAEVASYRALGVDTPARIIPNGIAVDQYRTVPRADVCARWGIPPAAFVILFLSRVHPIKGAEKLLEAFLRIHREFPSSHLVLAGPDEWGLERAFRDRAAAEGLGNRVTFPGMVAGEEKLDLLARANLFCLPSDAEGFSMAVLEALASGTAVLLSPGCHFPEVVGAAAGWVVDPDPAPLSEGLRIALADPGRTRLMGEQAREFVERDYSWERVTDQMVDAYQEGLDRVRRRAAG